MAEIIVKDWMIEKLNLSGLSLLAYALIYTCTQKGKGGWFGGYDDLATRIGGKQRGTIKAVNELIESKLVEKGDCIIQGKIRTLLTSTALSTDALSTDAQNTVLTLHSVQSTYSSNNNNNYSDEDTQDNTQEKKLSNDSKEILSTSCFKDLWNSIVTNCSKVTVLSEPRRKKVISRIKEMGELGDVNEIITICLEKINNSSFCTGNNVRGWKASFDWFIDNGNNWVKVYEGRYDNKDGKTINSVRNSIVDYPDGTYSLKDFNNECLSQITQYGIEFRRALQRGSSIKKVNGRWTI